MYEIDAGNGHRTLGAVTVYCGSSSGRDAAYGEAAQMFGRILASERIRLVWGGGDLGLMGGVSRAVLSNNGEAQGFMPDFLTQKERPAPNANVTLTPDMHSRKWSLFEGGDGLAILPGGIGTLEEFFEMLTWNQLGLHTKPMVVLSVGGYWNKLFDLLEHVEYEGFVPARIRYDCLYHVHNVDEILPTMRQHLRTNNVVSIKKAAG